MPGGEFNSKQWFKYKFKYLFYGYTTAYKSLCFYHMVIIIYGYKKVFLKYQQNIP